LIGDRKYYERHIKITKTKNKNLDFKNLLFCYTGDEYEKLSEVGTYCGYNKHECLNAFEQSLYKYTEKYFESDNIIYENRDVFFLNNEPDFLSFHGRTSNIIVNNFDDKNNVHVGEELVVGLYYKDEITHKYIFMRNSDFNKVKQMFTIVNHLKHKCI
jgi:hypothetical protein